MRKIILILILLISNTLIFGQTDKEKQKIIDSYKFLLTNHYIDIDANIDYTLEINDNSNPINNKRITPFFALFLFKQQKNRFEYKNKIFHWNDIPINLFEELNDFLKKFPHKDFSEQIKKFDTELNNELISISKGVTLNFLKYNGSYHLTDIEIEIDDLDNPKDNDFGIFLIEGFPIKHSYLDTKDFRIVKDKIYENTNYKFGHSMGMGHFSTPFEKVEIKDINILQNYFRNSEWFVRLKNKHIENRINLYNVAGRFRFNYEITVIGTDPEEQQFQMDDRITEK
ncbi:MAG: hypothetical protein ACK5MZ_06770 [Aestuariibaculum sp.]